MKKSLDEELEHALDETSNVADAAYAPPADAATAPKKAVSIGLLAVLLVMAGGIVTIVLFGFREAAVYALPANELRARAGELEGRKVRVDGELVPGSLMKRDKPCEYRFSIRAKGETLDVVYADCVIPDTFRDRPEGGVKVTVTGVLKGDGHFEATEVLAKCASKYDPKTHEVTLSDGTKVKSVPSAMMDGE